MQVLFVMVGERRFAIDCTEVAEVLPVVTHRSAGTGPAWLLGLINVRGALIPLVDLSIIVGGVATSLRLGSRIIVLKLESELLDFSTSESDAGSRGASLVGLLVPEVLGLGERDFAAPGAHLGFSFAGAPHLGPTIADDEGTVQLLRCRRILEGDTALRELPQRAEL